MRSFILLLFCLAWKGVVPVLAQSYDQQKVQLQFFNHYGKAYARGSLAENVIGSQFLNDDWQAVEIKFKDTLLSFEAVKVNLLNSNLEVLYQGEEKMIANSFFEYVEIAKDRIKQRLKPAGTMAYEGKTLTGFVEILGEGKTRVVVQHYIMIREPHNQAHITGGFTANRLIKERNIYLLDQERLVLIRRKKDLEDLFKRQSSALENYFKTQAPDIQDPRQLLRLVETLNSRA
ncbi:MAG: hypothetical protein ACOYOO_09725 [Saprospiraceae bacterium]